MKNTKLFITATLTALTLTSCVNTPDSIKSNKHSANTNSGEIYVEADHIYDSFDAAFETDYSKFKLPEKSDVSICKPNGVYDLELAYINADNDIDWLSEKVTELQSALEIDISGKVETAADIAELKDSHSKISITRYANPYCCWQASETGVSMINSGGADIQLFYLDRPTRDKADSDLLSAAEKAVSLANTFSQVLGEELDNSASDGYIIKTENGTGYELEIQKSYKGIGIQNLISKYSNATFVKGNTLMSASMQTYVNFNSELEPEYYVGCNAFKVAKAEPIDEMISFKGACDLLEENLADKIDIQFDDVKLMYEPRGTELEMTDTPENITCTPKWYFIIDDDQSDDMHTINYITVDCVSGEIFVQIP